MENQFIYVPLNQQEPVQKNLKKKKYIKLVLL